MIESTDYLLYQHFGKFLDDKNVEILDPATGTGTFICDIIDHISDKEKLKELILKGDRAWDQFFLKK